MPISVLDVPQSLSRYLFEILQTWGVRDTVLMPQDQPVDLRRILIVPAGHPTALHESVLDHVQQGGAVIVLEPHGAIASALGIQIGARRDQPLRLRVHGMAASGLAGEALPIVGGSPWVDGVAFDDARCLAGLYDPARIDGVFGECPGIIETTLGKGRVIAVTFDLARSVLLLRQGDPANTERRLHNNGKHTGTPKPSDLAVDIGPRDCGWMPYADMLSRLMVDLLERISPAPLPLVGHLPAEQPAITLFSGDEDRSDPRDTHAELDWLASRGASMSLYIIPEASSSTQADVARYREHHDIGPHPDLVFLRSAPVAQRVAEYERQINAFVERFGLRPRTISNHVATWAGYLDLVEVQARCGIRMDLNYFSGHFHRDRNHAPYSPFGSAMPMRFCTPTGTMLHVLQQPRHLHDDIMFAPGGERYSFGYTPAGFAPYLNRLLRDACHRFHTPVVANIHPGNWALFSAPFGQMIVEQSQSRGMSVWSFERWLDFREAAESCRVECSSWDGKSLALTLSANGCRDDLRIWLPQVFASQQVVSITHDGQAVRPAVKVRYDRTTLMIPFRPGVLRVNYSDRP
jgi:hypothetical protein